MIREGVAISGKGATVVVADLGEINLDRMRNLIPRGEPGMPADIGHAVANLATEEADHATSASIIGDGSETLVDSQLALEEITDE